MPRVWSLESVFSICAAALLAAAAFLGTLHVENVIWSWIRCFCCVELGVAGLLLATLLYWSRER